MGPRPAQAPSLRILHVDSGRVYRGGQNQVRLLMRELAREPGVEQRLVTRRGSELARRVSAAGGTVREVPWSVGLDPRAWWRLVVEGIAFDPHVVHAHDGHAVDLAAWARRWVGGEARLVATRRVAFPVRRSSSLFRADYIIAISAAVRDTLLTAGLLHGEIGVVPSGIDAEEVCAGAVAPLGLRARLELPDGVPVAAHVAMLEPPKDQATLIRAAAAARELRADLHWVVAGDGKARSELERQIHELGLADRVHLVGYVERVDALLRESDVLVMPSREEGLGSVVLHALALGKPVVATRAGGLPEIVPGDWLVPVGDADGLARKVVQALNHPSPFPFPQQCTAAAMARGVLAVYRALV